MKILITGKGFVSLHLQKQLSQTAGHNIFVYRRENKIDNVVDFAPDLIFHTAADLYEESRMFASNVQLTHNLLEATKYINYKSFIYIGSSSEYGLVDHPMRETLPLSPRTMYEVTKACGSMLCQGYARIYDKPIVIARPFSLYGPYDTNRKLIPTLFRCFAQNIKPSLVENSLHDWIYIDDFVRGLLILAFSEKDKIKGDVVNFGSGIQTSNIQVFRMLEKIFDKKMEYDIVEDIRSYDTNTSWVCDPTYAREKYGFECQYDLEKGLYKTHEYSATP